MFGFSSFSELPFSTVSGTAVPPPIIIVTTGGYDDKKRFKKEIDRRFKNKNEIIRAFERIIEGKPDVVEEIITPFLTEPFTFVETLSTTQNIDYDRLLLDIDRVERIWQHFIELDDEDVLTLL
jgi:hypothetical protein|tara:strand:- start:95 stop:463 length:369 start_codon:yes stop_codon:yes gene_type:complete